MRHDYKTFALCVALAALAFSGAAQAKFQTLYSFCQDSGCSTGGGPRGSLLGDKHGNLYGVAYYGGANGQGVAYALRRKGKSWTYQVIYDFCAKRHCADGAVPSTPLIADVNGNLYGAAQGGGKDAGGVFFQLSPPAAGQDSWKETVLYSFCSQTYCLDGGQPLYRLTYAGAAAGAAYDGQSPLYGVATSGGKQNGGVLYTVTPGASGWVQTALYSFCAVDPCADGEGPTGGPTLAPDGNLYGVTYYGGSENYGVLYRFAGSSYQVLHNFCAGCSEGGGPDGTPALDAAGNLYGAAKYGGVCSGECGTIYRFTPESQQYTVLYNFCQAGHCGDGNEPYGDLLLDGAGNLYGTTRLDGKRCDGYRGAGIAYRLTGPSFNRLHTFCGFGGGEFPNPGLAFGEFGKLYGTTAAGGDQVVFQVSP